MIITLPNGMEREVDEYIVTSHGSRIGGILSHPTAEQKEAIRRRINEIARDHLERSGI